MAKAKRDIGLEILEGLREIKRGEHGRVITIPCTLSSLHRPNGPERPICEKKQKYRLIC